MSKFSGIETVNVKDILPVTTDLESLKKNFTTLLSRVVPKYIPYFRKHVDAKAILQHIQCKYLKEMSQKSEVVRALYSVYDFHH